MRWYPDRLVSHEQHTLLIMSTHSPNLFIELEKPADELDACNDKISLDEAFTRFWQYFSLTEMPKLMTRTCNVSCTV